MINPLITCRCGQQYRSATAIKNDKGILSLTSVICCPSCLRHDNVAKASYNKEEQIITKDDIDYVNRIPD